MWKEKNGWLGTTPCTWNFSPKWPHSNKKTQISNRYSLVARLSRNTYEKRIEAFQFAWDEVPISHIPQIWWAQKRKVSVFRPKIWTTRKRGNCECIATWGHPTRATPALSRFNYDAVLRLKSLNHIYIQSIAVLGYSVFAADTLYFTPWPRPLILRPFIWPWTVAYRLWRDETLYQIWTQSSNPRRSYCDFSVDLMTLNIALRVSISSADNFHQVWPSTTYPCLNYSVFWCWYVMSSCDLDLWPVDIESSWYIKCHVIKVCTGDLDV